MRWLCFAAILTMFFSTLASATTITIDDQNGDPTTGNKISYLPEGAWGSGSIPECSQCQPPPTGLASGETFTGSLFNHNNKPNHTPFNATVKFFGTSVSVSCILSNSLSNPPGNTDMTFVIDGAQAGTFHHFPTGSSGFLPNQTVFISSTLPLAEHTLVIFNGNFNGGTSLVILDSVTYTSSIQDESLTTTVPSDTLLTSSPTASASVPAASAASVPTTPASASSVKTSHTAAIVGGVVAVLAVLLLLGLAFLYARHRRNQRDQHRSNVPVSKSFLAPFSDLWASGTPRSQPDMAPVPFPAPAPPVSQPRPTARPRRSAPAPSSGSHSRISRISFNPNLLVGRLRRQPPPPIATQPPADPRMATASPALPSGNPLLRQASAQSEALDRVASIQAWQQRTHEMTADQPVVHPLDMSEVDLSSHYDESSVSSPQPPPPPSVPPPVPRSPQPQRRFTVMNN